MHRPIRPSDSSASSLSIRRVCRRGAISESPGNGGGRAGAWDVAVPARADGGFWGLLIIVLLLLLRVFLFLQNLFNALLTKRKVVIF